MNVLRCGRGGKLFEDVRAPSTSGTFLRSSTRGHVRQLDAVAARFLSGPQTATTPTSPPAILGTRLHKGSVASAKGSPKLLRDAPATLQRTSTRNGLVIVRADSASDNHVTVAAAGLGPPPPHGAIPAVRRAVAGIAHDAWTAIEDSPRSKVQPGSPAPGCTAFTGRRLAEHVSARSIVRRVKRSNPAAVGPGQGELFDTFRCHAVIEAVIAEAEDGALAHLPSEEFQANAAWWVLAATAHDLTRAIVVLAGTAHRERAGTVRRELISLPARVASSARRLRLHAPSGRPWRPGFEHLQTAISQIARRQSSRVAMDLGPGRGPVARDPPASWQARTTLVLPNARIPRSLAML